MAKKKSKSKKQVSSAVKTPISLTSTKHEDVIAAALSTVNTPVLMKMCRLCEAKDGPFLNIFDSDKSTAKKIEDLMPFAIAEYDELPHKICFRCSAKVEELHEFVQKCVRTQHSLHETLGKKAPSLTKNKLRTQWEEKLNKSNISNDDICDALIKKAMEGIKDIPLMNSQPEDDDKPLKPKKLQGPDDTTVKNEVQNNLKGECDPDIALKNLKLSIEKCDNQNKAGAPVLNNTKLILGNQKSTNTSTPSDDNLIKPKKNSKKQTKQKEESDNSEDDKKEKLEPVKEDPPFNIMDYVTTIKVNSVGILFQCKLCNRNYLKKEVVESHSCAKNGIPKIDLTVNIPPPEPPKLPNTVKYIKIDHNKRPSTNKEKIEESKKVTVEEPIEKPKPPLKPKIGPASKMKKYAKETNSENESQNVSTENKTEKAEPVNASLPTVTFPTNPNPNLLYKLVPGPNNTFTLVSGASSANQDNEDTTEKAGRKRKFPEENLHKAERKDSKKGNLNNVKSKPSTEEVIDLGHDSDDSPTEQVYAPSYPVTVPQPHPALIPQTHSDTAQPYPVRLFQTRPHHSTTYPTAGTSETPTFTTPAMKKQSYTVVQTGNPSKLVISTKPVAPVEEVPKKRQKKHKAEETANTSKDPYNVTIEDVTPPKEPGFFTFINVDPLLQPSYVLPTNNIIQESQISTSTPAVKDKSDTKDKYNCNMCGEAFSREKKLLTHIQSHYSKMDEEDKQREKSSNKKRGKKS